jgi:hypothetical protein
MTYKPFATDVLFLADVTFRRGAVNGYVWTSDANGKGSWQAGGGGVTPAALTKVDDTNVTLTLGGTPATALLQATSITVGWSGQLAVARGGTGLSALGTANQLIRVNAGATALEYFTPTYLTGLTVGTTPIASGTVGRILFEGASNVLQESSNLFWDNTNSRLSLGFGSSPTARLDILAASTSGSNLALRVRDNGNTFNQFTVYDNGAAKFSAVASTGLFIGYRTNFGRNWVYLTTQDISSDISNPTITAPTIVVKNDVIAIGSGLSATYSDIVFFDRKFPGTGAYNETWGIVVTPSNSGGGISLNNGTGNSSYVYSFEPNGNSYWYATARSHQYTANGTAVMRISSGTAPTSTFADSACIYVNDISAGNAAFHTRAEGSHIFYAGENVGMRSNHDLKLAANNTVYAVLSTSGRMFVGGSTTPTAVLHLAAGTTAASTAPLKFTSGNLLTAAEAGAVEFLTDKAYLTITTGAARKEVTLNDAALTSGVTPVATTNGRLIDGLTLASGTYTPTLTGVTNVSSTTAFTCQYMRVGNVVTVSGKISVTATANNSQTVLGISLPIASNFAADENCGGLAHTINNTAADQHGASIYADATNDRATFEYYETHGSADVFTFTFTYRII